MYTYLTLEDGGQVRFDAGRRNELTHPTFKLADVSCDIPFSDSWRLVFWQRDLSVF